MTLCSSPQCQSTVGCVCGARWTIQTIPQLNTMTFTHELGCPYMTAAGGTGQCTCTPEQKQIKALRAEIADLKHDIDRHLTLTSEQATEIVGKDTELERLELRIWVLERQECPDCKYTVAGGHQA